MDFITGLLPSPSIHGMICDTLLVVVDRLTKYAVYIETSSKLTAEGVANPLIYYLWSHFRFVGSRCAVHKQVLGYDALALRIIPGQIGRRRD